MNYLDLHTHTISSGHGYSTLNENVHSAKEHGLKIYGLSEHTPKMPGSTHPYYFRNLHVIPDMIQGVRVLKGAELNIMDLDGSFDLDERTLQGLDYAIASLHAPCYGRMHTIEENTEAMINAVKSPYVKILGHPDDSRYPIEREAIVLACKETHTLIEVNNSSMNPKCSRVGGRENMLEMLKLCKKHQLPVIFGSDAHYCDLVGRFEGCEEVCQAAEFPEELIVNKNPELIKEYFDIDINEL